jgi:hypothetical protein
MTRIDAVPTDSRDRGRISDELERWMSGNRDTTVAGLTEQFAEKSFAILFVLLLCVSALPLPTGGATHVLEIIAMLVALQLIAGRDHIWLPSRWRNRPLASEGRQRFIDALLKIIRALERISRPRFRFVFGHRVSNLVFGVLVFAGSLAAFLAPPFSGLDTLPSLAVVLLSLGVLLEDFAIVVAALIVGAVGIVLELVLGSVAIHFLGELF